MRAAYVAWSVVAVVVVATAGVVLSVTFRPIEQPIEFNHRLHVEDLGAECADCHAYALTGVRATIPNLATCADCHDEPLTESEEEIRLTELIEAGTPIPWRKIYWVEDHVYFSHRRHTAVAEIGCDVCHGSVGEMERPPTRPITRITMNKCMQCHEEMEASNDCIVCHR